MFQKKILLLTLVVYGLWSIVYSLPALAGHRDEGPETLEKRVSKLEGDIEKINENLGSTMIEKLEAQGHIINQFGRFSAAIGSTGIMQGVLRNEGNGSNSLAGNGSLDITISSTFTKNFVATVHLESGVYNGIDNMLTNPLLFGAANRDDIATGQVLSLDNVETFLEARFYNEKLGFAAGLIDPTVFFDTNMVANDETSKFLNGGFKNNTTIEFPVANAIGGLVSAGTGIVKVSAGIFDAAANGTNMENNAFWIGEVELMPEFAEKEHHYRIYGWGNHDNGSAVKADPSKRGLGFGASFDQKILDWLTIFERVGYARKSTYDTYLSFSGGVEFSGSLYDREDDWFGFAGGAVIADKTAATIDSNEYVIEAYYNVGMAGGHVHLSPDLQYIVNPAGQSALNNAIFLGLRAQLDF